MARLSMRLRWVIGVGALGWFAAGAPEADAAIVVDMATVMQVPDPTFLYHFQVELTNNIVPPGEEIATNDFFTIYDIQGLIPGTNNQPPNWAATFQFVGITPIGVNPPDDPTLLNVTWTFIGDVPILAPAMLGGFTVESRSDASRHLAYSWQTTLIGDGHRSGTTTVDVLDTPEPSSLVLAGIGLPAAFLWLRRRSRVA
jgi:hypothetical protein